MINVCCEYLQISKKRHDDRFMRLCSFGLRQRDRFHAAAGFFNLLAGAIGHFMNFNFQGDIDIAAAHNLDGFFLILSTRLQPGFRGSLPRRPRSRAERPDSLSVAHAV